MHKNSLKNGKWFLILLNDGWMVNLAMGSFGYITVFLIFWHSLDPWICICSACWKQNLKQIEAIPHSVSLTRMQCYQGFYYLHMIFDNLIIVNVNAIFIWKIVTQISKGHHAKLMMIAELMGYVSGHIHIHPKGNLLHHFYLQVLPSNFCYRRCKCNQKPKKCKAGKLCKTEDDCGLNDAGKCVLK